MKPCRCVDTNTIDTAGLANAADTAHTANITDTDTDTDTAVAAPDAYSFGR